MIPVPLKCGLESIETARAGTRKASVFFTKKKALKAKTEYCAEFLNDFLTRHQKNTREEICDDWHSNLILAQTFLARNSNYA